MTRRVRTPMALAFTAFRLLPAPLRRLAVRIIAPTYVVGTVVVIRDAQGSLLLLRERHHDGWGLPGGLVNRGELPRAAAVREIHEEIDVHMDPTQLSGPHVNVDPQARRVDIVFVCERSDVDPRPQQPEVLEARWFPVTAMPDLFAPTLDVLRVVGVLDDAPD